ncbi:MAG: PocR ligand-binding domain-containing protein [Candidatus Ozemobacteraceae bacterium]
MAAEQNSFLVDGKYGIRDLVDMDQLRDIFERFTRATGFTIGFLDHPDMNILIATGWRDICTKFHRGCSISAEICTKSNHRLLFGLNKPGQLMIEECENGLVDCATPIIIKGVHIASLATGQLLFEKPDLERFSRQAQKYGFDETQYLKSLEEVPVVSKTQVMDATAFLGSLAVVISEMGYARLATQEKNSSLENEISQRKIVTRKLRESEEKYRALVDTTGTGYVIIDRNGVVLDANPEYVRLTGNLSLQEIFGHMVNEWTAPHDLARNAQEVRKCFECGLVRHLEIDYMNKDGIIIPVEIDATVVPGPKIVTLVRDITDRKKTEENRFKMEKQILQLQKLESLGLLAGGIAHDFNNLLMGVLGNADLALLNPGVSNTIREKLNGIISAGRQASDLCRQLLVYSGKGRFILQNLDLKELIQSMGTMLEVSISRKVSLKYSLGKQIPIIEGDPSQIRQILMNLIINASEAIGDNVGTISLSLGVKECSPVFLDQIVGSKELVSGTYVIIEVQDTGCGMDEITCSQIFDPFFSTKKTGRGLGLAAVMGIVRSHKGIIKVYSEKGRGTSFKVLFPVIKGEFNQPSENDSEILKWQGSGTILLADDQDLVRNIGKGILEHLGFKVILAEDGLEAVDIFSKTATTGEEKIVCVILDLSMPKKDGVEVFREIRAMQPKVPIILSSGYNEQEFVSKLVMEEKIEFIQKPYEVKIMAAKLKAVLQKQEQE